MAEFIGYSVLTVVGIYIYFWMGVFFYDLDPDFSDDIPYSEYCHKEPLWYLLLPFWPIISFYMFLLILLPYFLKSVNVFHSAGHCAKQVRNFVFPPNQHQDEKPNDESKP